MLTSMFEMNPPCRINDRCKKSPGGLRWTVTFDCISDANAAMSFIEQRVPRYLKEFSFKTRLVPVTS